jgi:hypothetical protein
MKELLETSDVCAQTVKVSRLVATFQKIPCPGVSGRHLQSLFGEP